MKLKRRTIVVAGAMALLVSAAVAVTTGSAGTARAKAHGVLGATSVPISPALITVQSAGTTEFTSSSSAPVTSPSKFAPDEKERPTGVTSQGLGPKLPTVTGLPVNAHHTPGYIPGRGLNANDSGTAHGFDIEPPDQGLCSDGKYILEVNNLVVRVFRADTTPFSGVATLEDLFGDEPAFVGPNGAFEGDARCYYDTDTQRWFITQIFLASGHKPNKNFSRLEILVSQTSDPTGLYNKYVIDTTNGTSKKPKVGHSGCPCGPDQPVLGASRDALVITANEFSILGFEFNGAQIYALDKQALAAGSPTPTAITINAGQIPNPDGPCVGGVSSTCWYSISPAQVPDAHYGLEDQAGGTELMLSALDFFNVNDKRIAVWSLSGLGSLHGGPISLTLHLDVIKSEAYGVAPPSDQMPGPTPTHDALYPDAPPVGQIDSGDDRMQQVYWDDANGLLWGSLTTGMMVNDGHGSSSQLRAGIAWFAVGSSGKLAAQGYVGALGSGTPDNLIFPALAVTSTGHALLSYGVAGADRWPSTGYSLLSVNGVDGVHLAHVGHSPQDGFTEYEGCGSDPTPTECRPRWGDYSAATSKDGAFYLAAEYIQFPNCSDNSFFFDPTCGGTRSVAANWGTSVDRLASH